MFEWNEKYSIGIKEIDQQHQKLFSIGSELVTVLDNITKGFDEYDNIKALLRELYDYTVYHFNTEENLMAKYDFIDLASHRFQHKLFAKRLEEFNLEELDAKQNEATMELLDFISTWITNHILKIDQKYATYLKEKGVS